MFGRKKPIETEQISAEEQKIRAYTQNEYAEVKSYVSGIAQKINDLDENLKPEKINIEKEENLDMGILLQKYNELVDKVNNTKKRLVEDTEIAITNLTDLCLYSSKIIDGEENFILPFTSPIYKNGNDKSDPIRKVKIDKIGIEDLHVFEDWLYNVSTTGELINNGLTVESAILKSGGFLTSKEFTKIVYSIIQKKLKFRNANNGWENVYDTIDYISKENPLSLQPLEQHIHIFFSKCYSHFGLFYANIQTQMYHQAKIQNQITEEQIPFQNQNTQLSDIMKMLQNKSY